MVALTSWGPVYWKFLHLLAVTYPDKPSYKDKVGMSQFLTYFPNLIPCETCRNHTVTFFRSNSQQINQALESKQELFYFFWMFHNSVNTRIGKPVISFQEAKILHNYFD